MTRYLETDLRSLEEVRDELGARLDRCLYTDPDIPDLRRRLEAIEAEIAIRKRQKDRVPA